MIMQDKLEKERADAKNAVEEYVYEMRDKLYSVLELYVTEAVSNGFLFISSVVILVVHGSANFQAIGLYPSVTGCVSVEAVTHHTILYTRHNLG